MIYGSRKNLTFIEKIFILIHSKSYAMKNVLKESNNLEAVLKEHL